MSRIFSRADRSVLGMWWWTVDRFMLAAVMILIVCGIMMVATASPPVAVRIGLDQYHFIIRHVVVLVPAVIIMLGISLFDTKTIWRISSIGLAAGLLAMIAVLFIGMEIKGAQRWIHLPGFSLQPSEFVKPCFAVVSAWMMSQQKYHPEFPGNKMALALYMIVVTLLLLQPDLGMTIVTSCIFGVQVFLAGFPMIVIVGLVLTGVLGLVGAYFTFDHVHSRIERFLNPEAGDNYQVGKAIEAFQQGGFFGVGPGQGMVKLEIPDSHADFIFAVGGEEMGLIFIAALVAIYAFIILRGFNRIIDSEYLFIILAAGGLLTMFGLQAFIHMGSNVHLLPAKGMTLPFISYGGSSLLAIAFSMGIILALTRRQVKQGAGKSGSIRSGSSIAKAGLASQSSI